MSRWFRFYDDVINDPKVIKLPVPLRWAWVGLLCVASKNDGKLPANEDIALSLRVSEAVAAEYVTKLTLAKLIDNVNGVFVPHNWDGRQFKSDTSTERVKKHRNGKRNVSGNVTRNVSETLGETAPEAEAETDTEQSRADAPAAVDEDLRKRAAALGVSVSLQFSTRGYSVPALERCQHWLQTGYAAGTVLKAVENVLKRGKPIATLDYFDGAIRDLHGKEPVPTSSEKPELVSVFVEVDTPEWRCHCAEAARLKRRPPIVKETTINGVVKSGWWFKKLIPDGYDPCTYEYTPPKTDEAAA